MPMFNYIPCFRMVGISRSVFLPTEIRDFVFRIQRAQRLPIGENSLLKEMDVVSQIIINYKQPTRRKVRSTLTLSHL